MSDTVFLAPTEKTMTISAADQDRILTDLIRFEIAAFEQTRAVAPARSRELAEAESDREEAVLATLRDAFWLRDRSVAEAPIRATAARLGLTLDAADPDWPCLASAATRTLIDIVEVSTGAQS